MPPLNPSIIMGVERPRIQMPEAQDPFEQMGKAARLDALLGQGKLQGMQIQDLERTQADQKAIRDAYAQSGGDEGVYRKTLQGLGRYDLITKLDADKLDLEAKRGGIDKDKSIAEENRFDTAMKQAEQAGSLFAYAKQNPAAWPGVKRQLALVNPEAAAQLPDQYDPQFVDTAIAKGQTLTQRIEAERQAATLAETQRHNKTSEGLTARGQNMTDARASDRLDFDRGVAVSDAGGPSQVGLTKQFGKAAPNYRWKPDGSQEVIPGSAADTKTGAEGHKKETQVAAYLAARDGLMSGMSGTDTGAISGRIPAMTTGQQIAEGSVAAMAPVLKELFRVSGEGVFTDKDQELLLNMVPKRTDTKEAREKKMENIDSIISAKLGRQIPSYMPKATKPAKTNLGASVSNW